MWQQARIVATVARDPTLGRIELAYLGFNMAEFATWIAILVYAYSLGGASVAALVALIQLIPAGLVAPFAAYAADRFRRDRVLLAGYLWQAGSFGATALALYAHAAVAITIAVATIAACSVTVTRPVQAAILPSITHTPGDLTAANAVSALAENVGVFSGPLLGGLLLTRSEPGDVFAVFAVVLLASAALVARLPARVEHLPIGHHGATPREILAESFAGFGAVRRESRVLLLVLILAATTVVIGALDLLFVATAIDLLHLGEAWAGFLYAAFGLGGVIGSVATVALVGRRRMTPALAAGGSLYTLPISAIGVVPAPFSAAALFAVSGIGFSIATVAGRTLLQRVTQEALLARVFGVLEGLTMFALAIGSVLAGTLIAAFGITWALIGIGLLVPTLIAIAWVRLGAIDQNARPIDPEALALLRRLPIFAPLSALSIERILSELTWVEVPAGDVVIREGDAGDRFYVLAEGQVSVTVRSKAMSERNPGEYFGEIALLRDVPRTATVTALTRLRLIAIERERFLEAVTGHPQSRATVEAVAAERMAVGHR
jgi:MFS family permease